MPGPPAGRYCVSRGVAGTSACGNPLAEGGRYHRYVLRGIERSGQAVR